MYTVADVKTTSAWTIVYGSQSPSWEAQLNLYAWLMRENGYSVDELWIYALLKDWSAFQYRKAPSTYPESPIVCIRFQVWSESVLKNYLERRLAHHMDSQPPPCTFDERWEKRPTYAIYRSSNSKTAYRVLDTEDEAIRMVKELRNRGLDPWFERRLGERTRCQHYCRVSRYCSEYANYLRNLQLGAPDGD